MSSRGQWAGTPLTRALQRLEETLQQPTAMPSRTSLCASFRAARLGAFCSAPARGKHACGGQGARTRIPRAPTPHLDFAPATPRVPSPSSLALPSRRSHPASFSWRLPQRASPTAACPAWPPSSPCPVASGPWLCCSGCGRAANGSSGGGAAAAAVAAGLTAARLAKLQAFAALFAAKAPVQRSRQRARAANAPGCGGEWQRLSSCAKV